MTLNAIRKGAVRAIFFYLVQMVTKARLTFLVQIKVIARIRKKIVGVPSGQPYNSTLIDMCQCQARGRKRM